MNPAALRRAEESLLVASALGRVTIKFMSLLCDCSRRLMAQEQGRSLTEPVAAEPAQATSKAAAAPGQAARGAALRQERRCKKNKHSKEGEQRWGELAAVAATGGQRLPADGELAGVKRQPKKRHKAEGGAAVPVDAAGPAQQVEEAAGGEAGDEPRQRKKNWSKEQPAEQRKAGEPPQATSNEASDQAATTTASQQERQLKKAKRSKEGKQRQGEGPARAAAAVREQPPAEGGAAGEERLPKKRCKAEGGAAVPVNAASPVQQAEAAGGEAGEEPRRHKKKQSKQQQQEAGAGDRPAAGAGQEPAEGPAVPAVGPSAARGGAIDYPHPDIPALLEQVGQPNYRPPYHWSEAEKARLVKLVEDERYRRQFGMGALNYRDIDRHLKRHKTTCCRQYICIQDAAQRGRKQVRNKNPTPFHRMVAYALQQLPDFKGTLDEVCDEIEKNPVYQPMLDKEKVIGQTTPTWVKQVSNRLAERPEFVNTGERRRGRSGKLQTVWRYTPPDEAAVRAAEEAQRRRGQPPPGPAPFLGRQGTANG